MHTPPTIASKVTASREQSSGALAQTPLLHCDWLETIKLSQLPKRMVVTTGLRDGSSCFMPIEATFSMSDGALLACVRRPKVLADGEGSLTNSSRAFKAA